MEHLSIPTCYFPGTTIFIDDNRDFLLNFVLQLDEWLAFRVFDSPFDALESIQKKYRERDLIVERCYNSYQEIRKPSASDKQSSLPAIQAELYNSRRFCDVSVLVVDYAMPGMNGLEFCRQIANTNIKKILLIGETDEGLAITALNEGLIHRYIHKSDPDVAELITRSISELQWQYFQDISTDLVRLLSFKSPVCLCDQSFVDFFRKFCHENGVVEFYLMDNSGSFLLLDVDAKVSYLIVKDDDKIHSDLGTAPLIANEKYFYSHVQEHHLFDIREDGLFSYHSHLQEIDAEELLVIG